MGEAVFLENLGKTLKDLRQAKELTLSEVADELNFSRPMLSMIEAGKRKISVYDLVKLSEHYEVDVGDIVKC